MDFWVVPKTLNHGGYGVIKKKKIVQSKVKQWNTLEKEAELTVNPDF